METPFQLELLARLFAGAEQRRACSCSLVAAQLRAARGAGASITFPWACLLPKTVAGQEAVFEAGPHHLLKVAVGERVSGSGADVFVSEVDAGDAFIIGRERHRHVI